ncbi:Myb-like DNA-binding domain protein, putative [Babesia caballi]|uniref:Myb-like DNA-binding domain protein, putative n=1 Tax=Babesia caballi TaxID=5871 RepID=A0AAV4LTZ1_BABCB|nr:Myb-like DNA-binding domain protein, putative [Babesia caballi]
MAHNHEYQATRRPRRLRDPYLSLTQSTAPVHTPSNTRYQRVGNAVYNAPEIAYREGVRREYGTRYKHHDSEDSYARHYDRTYLYARRGVYSHEYGEYNMRPKPANPPAKVARDHSYTTGRVHSAPRRTETSTNGIYRSSNINTRSTRRSVSRWDDAPAVLPPLPPEPTGKMQLRYSFKRQADSARLTPKIEEPVSQAVVTPPPERLERSRPFSPRIAKRRAAALQSSGEAAFVDPVVEDIAAIASEISDVNIEMYSSPEDATVKVEAAVQTPAPDQSAVQPKVDTAPEDLVSDTSATVKRKRGRPKLVRDATSQASPVRKKEKVKRAKVGVSAAGYAEGAVDTPTPKRTSARIRSNNSVVSYSISTRLADDTYEEQLKKAIAMSIKDAEDNPRSSDKTRNQPGDTSVDSNTKTKESSVTSYDDDMNDTDYTPVTPTKTAKRLASKSRNKPAGKTLTPTLTSKTSSRSRLTRRAQEPTTGPMSTESQINESQQPQPAEAEATSEKVAVVNDGPGSAKMLFFEEYLEMSERMYCGQPLCIRQVPDPAGKLIQDADANGESSDEEVPIKVEIDSPGYRSVLEHNREGAKAVCNTSHAPKVTADNMTGKGGEDELFEFQCSNLDLRFRVSFAMLTSGLRQSQMIDLWGPKEIVLFELGMFKHGKEFYEIQRNIPTKTVQEIVDMYYFWKKTNRYKLWKANRMY